MEAFGDSLIVAMDKIFPIRKKRCIYVNRTIDLDLYNALFPKICRLREKSSAPIYIYLDSRGGNVSLSEKLHELLRAPRYDGTSCKIVTVVPQLAASAAADLAILGDFCSGYPAAIIHCHGTRLSAPELTADNVDDVGARLRISNENHALKLAQKVSERLAFQIWLKKTELLSFAAEQLKESRSAKGDDDLIGRQDLTSIYFSYLQEKGQFTSSLSPTGSEFIRRCNARWERKSAMFELLAERIEAEENGNHHKRIAEQLMSQAIEGAADNDSTLAIARRVVEDATLLGETFPGGITGWEELAVKQGIYFLRPEEETEFEGVSDEEHDDFLIRKTKSAVMVNYLIATNLCQTLHESENPFSAIDAYNLGLVDEIYGMSHIYPSLRSIFETEDGGEEG